MTAEQLTLAPVHEHDPETSREAAAKVDVHGQYVKVLTALYNADRALTDDELGEATGLLRHSAGTRRGVAVKKGHVVHDGFGVSAQGNRARAWRLTDDGRDFVLQMRGEANAAA